MYLRTAKNQYGTPVDVYRCETCQGEFTVCPAHEDRSRDDQWRGCLAEACGSYDPARDADRFFASNKVVSLAAMRAGGVRSEAIADEGRRS